MSRPVAALLREIDQIKKSDLDSDTKNLLVASLRKQIAEAAAQLQLDLPSPASGKLKG